MTETLIGMEWPARCVACGIVTEDPDLWDSGDDPWKCSVNGFRHAWARVRDTEGGEPAP